MKIHKKMRLFFSILCFVGFFDTAQATCYVNSESHLPQSEAVLINSAITTPRITQEDVFAACGPSAKNADLNWTPDQAVRRALFDSPEVQNSADGCESYGHLLKAECNPEFPVLSIYFDPNGIYKIESFVIERNPNLNASQDLDPAIKRYVQSRIKVPVGDWANVNFLRTIKISSGDSESGIEMNIIQYLEMMNVLYKKYPSNDYRQAYIDYINGDRTYFKFYLAYHLFKKGLLKKALVTIQTVLFEE